TTPDVGPRIGRLTCRIDHIAWIMIHPMGQGTAAWAHPEAQFGDFYALDRRAWHPWGLQGVRCHAMGWYKPEPLQLGKKDEVLAIRARSTHSVPTQVSVATLSRSSGKPRFAPSVGCSRVRFRTVLVSE